MVLMNTEYVVSIPFIVGMALIIGLAIRELTQKRKKQGEQMKKDIFKVGAKDLIKFIKEKGNKGKKKQNL